MVYEKVCNRCYIDFVCNDKTDKYCYDCYDYKIKKFIDIYYPTKNEKIKKVFVGIALYQYEAYNKRLDTYAEAEKYLKMIECV